jgi:hypothetical protein
LFFIVFSLCFCHLKQCSYNGIGEIKAHPFFSNINWNSLHLMTPPFEPSLDGELDCGYFESATSEGVESMCIDEKPSNEMEPLANDPWKEGWDWSDSP